MDMDKLLTEITDAFFRKAEKERLDKDTVGKCVAGVQYLFAKNPKKKDKRCFICEMKN